MPASYRTGYTALRSNVRLSLLLFGPGISSMDLMAPSLARVTITKPLASPHCLSLVSARVISQRRTGCETRDGDGEARDMLAWHAMDGPKPACQSSELHGELA